MNIHLAQHHGMCFGVRDALRATHAVARLAPVTVLGQLVHNPEADRHLRALGVQQADPDHLQGVATRDVVITAHGTSTRRRDALDDAGFRVTDTTCPLVRKAHDALATLVREGYFPVVIGEASHAEVRGLTGDFPEALVVLEAADVAHVPPHPRIGIISQTTQPVGRALHLVDLVKRRHPRSEVRFVDTICAPTKQRQGALEELCARCDTIVVVGGRNSNNTRHLALSAERLGCVARQVESADELQPSWFHGARDVGVTAGTSTLDETVRAVVDRLQAIAALPRSASLWASLFGPRHASPKSPSHTP